MMGHNLCFYREIWLIIPKLSLLPLLIIMSSAHSVRVNTHIFRLNKIVCVCLNEMKCGSLLMFLMLMFLIWYILIYDFSFHEGNIACVSASTTNAVSFKLQDL